MVHQVARYADAYAVWESWNLTDFEVKCEHLLSLKGSLDNAGSSFAPVVGYHIEQASVWVSPVHNLVGPTGETNELYTAGRGVAVIVQDDNSKSAQQSACAMITAALVAGNSVIVCSDDVVFAQEFEQACLLSSLPTNLVQFVSYDAYHQLMEADIRNMAYVGNPTVELSINRQLASRTGAIVSLVSETDLAALPMANDPSLALRFVTERTRTINITAVGGNATLLELGNEAH
ncbi:1-pyrroline-5-carboxylate dehydrogenase [Vibrio sonorensis]|uniref:1-pyrroline-5-carboxylate dehydrogenase n=1 Tax=Vibrio sonorensis TaxID=1004316 RepID=UPI0008DAB89B|nr:1-pyrroline-5-carboxylate dehydrogenase [Vibrio sonorensis]